jgi:formate hydrogenlyase subunit 3/multisubunit Na+/H+ antiporter MnhD subunit
VKYATHHDLRYFSVLYHALLASIVLVLIAGDAVSFLVGWEAMSIASYLLVTYDYEREESRYAAFVMLAMSEAGTIAAAIAFILLSGAAGTLDFAGLRSNAVALSTEARWAVFLLSFFGFAVKAGLVPVNSWLPLAHPVAPTNVSALLSAVIVNLGIYGIVRFNFDLAPAAAPSAGLIVLVIGSVSALVGILYATVQAEMKRLLAHSTIENMGIVAAGLGVSEKRGDIAEDLAGGVVVHDHFRPYYGLTGVAHAFCNAHHLRGAGRVRSFWAARSRLPNAADKLPLRCCSGTPRSAQSAFCIPSASATKLSPPRSGGLRVPGLSFLLKQAA